MKANFLQRPRILVVDDEPGLRALLKWELCEQGMDVHLAQDGEEATGMVEKMSFDIVITDLTMPKVDGLMLLEGLKKIKPKMHVIITTGFGTVETAVQAMHKGAYDFMLKPVDMDVLVSLIQKALSNPHCSCTCKIHPVYSSSDKKFQ